MKAIFENQNELLYTAIYNYQDESLASYGAKRSVISHSDIAYEWVKKLVEFKIVENQKYLGIITTESKKIYNEYGGYEEVEEVTKYYIEKNIINFVEKLNDYRHQINTLKKHLKIKHS